MQKVKAIFISHEHTDHIRGLAGIAGKYDLPVYITAHTLNHCSVPFRNQLAHPLIAREPVLVGSLSITAFPKHHDAADPHSFIICCNGVTIGVFTDIGTPCDRLISHFSQCHAAFLEANYDEDMLENGKYPWFLKNRIRGGKGHLSNRQALEIFMAHRPPFMSHLFLSHLSKDNNCPEMVAKLFNTHAKGTQIVVASRYQQTAVFNIQEPQQVNSAPTIHPIVVSPKPMQLSLF